MSDYSESEDEGDAEERRLQVGVMCGVACSLFRARLDATVPTDTFVRALVTPMLMRVRAPVIVCWAVQIQRIGDASGTLQALRVRFERIRVRYVCNSNGEHRVPLRHFTGRALAHTRTHNSCGCLLPNASLLCLSHQSPLLGRYGDPVPGDLSAPLENAMSAYRTAETLQTMATRDSREARIANQYVADDRWGPFFLSLSFPFASAVTCTHVPSSSLARTHNQTFARFNGRKQQ